MQPIPAPENHPLRGARICAMLVCLPHLPPALQELDGVDDAADFEVVCAALTDVGVTPEMQVGGKEGVCVQVQVCMCMCMCVVAQR